MVAVYDKLAAQTIEYPIGEGKLVKQAIPTLAASLRSVGRIDSDEGVASLYRFATHHAEKARPSRVHNTFRKTMIFIHAVDMQVFNRDKAISINNLSTLLVGEIGTFETDAFMYSGYYFM